MTYEIFRNRYMINNDYLLDFQNLKDYLKSKITASEHHKDKL